MLEVTSIVVTPSVTIRSPHPRWKPPPPRRSAPRYQAVPGAGFLPWRQHTVQLRTAAAIGRLKAQRRRHDMRPRRDLIGKIPEQIVEAQQPVDVVAVIDADNESNPFAVFFDACIT